MSDVRVVHYLNQFFGQVGGEDKAGIEPRAVDEAVGPGRALQRALGGDAAVVRTLICGDNYFAERRDDAVERLLGMLRDARADVLVAGPAFSAGRYGVACGDLGQQAVDAGVPAIAGLSHDNPAVAAFKRQVVIVPTGATAVSMEKALAGMASLALKLGRGEVLAPPELDGYIPHGFRRNTVDQRNGAQRALAMLAAKVAGQPFQTEIPLPEFKDVTPAPPVADLASTRLALITSGGLVPRGNPDHLKSHVADSYGRYSIDGLDSLTPDRFEAFHGGFYTHFVNLDPNRLVPLDAVRAMVSEGRLGGLHPTLYTIAGNGTYPEMAERMATEIVPELKRAEIGGALITST